MKNQHSPFQTKTVCLDKIQIKVDPKFMRQKEQKKDDNDLTLDLNQSMKSLVPLEIKPRTMKNADNIFALENNPNHQKKISIVNVAPGTNFPIKKIERPRKVSLQMKQVTFGNLQARNKEMSPPKRVPMVIKEPQLTPKGGPSSKIAKNKGTKQDYQFDKTMNQYQQFKKTSSNFQFSNKHQQHLKVTQEQDNEETQTMDEKCYPEIIDQLLETEQSQHLTVPTPARPQLQNLKNDNTQNQALQDQLQKLTTQVSELTELQKQQMRLQQIQLDQMHLQHNLYKGMFQSVDVNQARDIIQHQKLQKFQDQQLREQQAIRLEQQNNIATMQDVLRNKFRYQSQSTLLQDPLNQRDINVNLQEQFKEEEKVQVEKTQTQMDLDVTNQVKEQEEDEVVHTEIRHSPSVQSNNNRIIDNSLIKDLETVVENKRQKMSKHKLKSEISDIKEIGKVQKNDYPEVKLEGFQIMKFKNQFRDSHGAKFKTIDHKEKIDLVQTLYTNKQQMKKDVKLPSIKIDASHLGVYPISVSPVRIQNSDLSHLSKSQQVMAYQSANFKNQKFTRFDQKILSPKGMQQFQDFSNIQRAMTIEETFHTRKLATTKFKNQMVTKQQATANLVTDNSSLPDIVSPQAHKQIEIMKMPGLQSANSIKERLLEYDKLKDLNLIQVQALENPNKQEQTPNDKTEKFEKQASEALVQFVLQQSDVHSLEDSRKIISLYDNKQNLNTGTHSAVDELTSNHTDRDKNGQTYYMGELRKAASPTESSMKIKINQQQIQKKKKKGRKSKMSRSNSGGSSKKPQPFNISKQNIELIQDNMYQTKTNFQSPLQSKGKLSQRDLSHHKDPNYAKPTNASIMARIQEDNSPSVSFKKQNADIFWLDPDRGLNNTVIYPDGILVGVDNQKQSRNRKDNTLEKSNSNRTQRSSQIEVRFPQKHHAVNKNNLGSQILRLPMNQRYDSGYLQVDSENKNLATGEFLNTSTFSGVGSALHSIDASHISLYQIPSQTFQLNSIQEHESKLQSSAQRDKSSLDKNQQNKVQENQIPSGITTKEYAIRELLKKGMSPLNNPINIQLKSSDGSALSGYDAKLKKNIDRVEPKVFKSNIPTPNNLRNFSPIRRSEQGIKLFEVEGENNTGSNSNDASPQRNQDVMNSSPSNKKPIKLYDNNKINTRYMMNQSYMRESNYSKESFDNEDKISQSFLQQPKMGVINHKQAEGGQGVKQTHDNNTQLKVKVLNATKAEEVKGKINNDLELTEEQTRKIEDSRNSQTYLMSSTHSLSNNRWILDQDKLPFPALEVPRVLNIQEGGYPGTELSVVVESESPMGNRKLQISSDHLQTDKSTQDNNFDQVQQQLAMKSFPASPKSRNQAFNAVQQKYKNTLIENYLPRPFDGIQNPLDITQLMMRKSPINASKINLQDRGSKSELKGLIAKEMRNLGKIEHQTERDKRFVYATEAFKEEDDYINVTRGLKAKLPAKQSKSQKNSQMRQQKKASSKHVQIKNLPYDSLFKHLNKNNLISSLRSKNNTADIDKQIDQQIMAFANFYASSHHQKFSSLRGVDEQGNFGQSYPQPSSSTYHQKKFIQSHYNNIQYALRNSNTGQFRFQVETEQDYFSLTQTNLDNDDEEIDLQKNNKNIQSFGQIHEDPITDESPKVKKEITPWLNHEK